MVSLVELSALVFAVFSRVKLISKEVIVSEICLMIKNVQ